MFANKICLITLLLPIAFASATTQAKVAEQESRLLSTQLTPVGATIEANSEGTIPSWTGKMRGTPAGLEYKGSGEVYPDPYADDKVLFTITGENYKQYAHKLSEGQKALFEHYPHSFAMPIYPSHRDGRYAKLFEERTLWNAQNAETINGIDGLQNFTGGTPFPLPKSGGEVIWNARVNQPIPVSDGLFDEFAVYPNGKRENLRVHTLFESPFAYTDRPVGTVDADIGDIAGLIFSEILAPARERGKKLIIHEPLDQVRHSRRSWISLPGLNRVRRAPNVGFDTQAGPGGFKTVDDHLGFNGSMERYEWKLIGKKEIYIPYHAYRFDTPGIDFSALLTPKHVNPHYMRYELHRVWVVEATLKKGMRHIYAKRRFYIDEDNWLIALHDSYDGHGELWRVGIQNSLYDYYLKGYILRSHINHDLQAKAYVANNLVNDTHPTQYDTPYKGKKFFSPNTLRRLSR